MPQKKATAAVPPTFADIPLAESYPIPSNNRLLAIEHPAILSSIETGVKSLGGYAALTTAFNCPRDWMNRQDDRDIGKPMLELRYRPDDDYQHPISSQPVKTQNIVIKVGKNRQNNKIEKVEVVGVVDTVLRFRDMADVQHHPYPDSKFAMKFEEKFKSMQYDKLTKFEISMEEDDVSNIDLMPPPVFSRTVIPHFYEYKQNTGLLVTETGSLKYRHIYRNKFITMVEKDIPTIPLEPSPNLGSPTTQSPSMQLCINRLIKLFQTRPISTRRAIFNTYLDKYGLGIADSTTDNWRPVLRFALPYVCYMFKSGPFRDAYVVLGVDPRKDSKWAKYQTAIFNFRTGKWRNKGIAQEDAEKLWQGRENHLFTGKEVGTTVVSYLIMDILDPILRKLLDESPLREKFHENDGWYPSDTLLKVRKIMRGKLLALREGRIPSDDEFTSILQDNSISTTPVPEESVLQEQREHDEDDEEDDEQVEGEIVEDEQTPDARLDDLMMNLVQQSAEHLISGGHFAQAGRPKVLDGDYGDAIYGDDEDE